jgi:small subunit ribosomal protein S16
MAVKIRLARGGSKKRPVYRIVVCQSTSARDGNFLEKIGTYNPLLSQDQEKRVVIDLERAKHWLQVGAQPTERVALFFGRAGLIAVQPIAERPTKGAPKKKAQERMKAEAEAAQG